MASRFSYCAVSALSLLGRLDALDKDLTVGFIERCKNFDGGFGMVDGAESHAAYGESASKPWIREDSELTSCFAVWTCVGTLAILDRLDVVDSDTLCWWLCERQLPNGGLNGRPEKLEDVRRGSVCPSRKVKADPLIRSNRSVTAGGRSHHFPFLVVRIGSTLPSSQTSFCLLRCVEWFVAARADKNSRRLLSQDPDRGGIADRPEDVADVWHTVFGVAGEQEESVKA